MTEHQRETGQPCCNPEHAHDGPCGADECWWAVLFGSPEEGLELSARSFDEPYGGQS